MEPQEFMDKWGCSRKQLADLLDLSLPVVERWFFKPDSSNYAQPREGHKRRLSEIDFILETVDRTQETLDRCPKHLRFFRQDKN